MIRMDNLLSYDNSINRTTRTIPNVWLNFYIKTKKRTREHVSFLPLSLKRGKLTVKV